MEWRAAMALVAGKKMSLLSLYRIGLWLRGIHRSIGITIFSS